MNKLKQSGMSSYLLLFVVIMVAFLMMCAFRIVPAYSENYYIVAALKSLAEQHPDDLDTMTRTQIRADLGKFYMLNNVRSEAAQALEVDRKVKGVTKVIIAYEVRVPILFNIDAVVSFNNVLDSSKPEECCKVSEK